jgi:hypothetical protein
VSSKQAKKKKHDLAERSGGDIVDISSQERARSTAIIQKYKKSSLISTMATGD